MRPTSTRYTLVIEWSAAHWQQELGAIATGVDTELGEILSHLEEESWKADRVHVAVSASLDEAERHLLRQAFCWWGCETVEITFLDDARFARARHVGKQAHELARPNAQSLQLNPTASV